MDLEVVRQLQPVAEVGAGSMHVQPGVIRRQPLGAGSQEVLGNVDAQVADRPQSFEQQAHLATGSAAQFDQVRPRPGDLTDVIGGVGENLLLGAGQVVLRLLADLLEQLRAASVVEEFRRHLLGRGGETGEHLVA